MRLLAIAIGVAVLTLAGCGGSGGGDQSTRVSTERGAAPTASPDANITGKLPAGAVEPADTTEEAIGGPAATEASPEAEASGPRSTGELEGSERSAVTLTVQSYVSALDRREAARVCALIEPRGLDLSDLPRPHGGCRGSVKASIGTRPPGGGPAWRRTTIVEMKPEALGDERARVTTTVTHRFSDRKYVSVEDDVIYLERVGSKWLIAKPSATFYRAVGYAQPPLRAFGPPAGW